MDRIKSSYEWRHKNHELFVITSASSLHNFSIRDGKINKNLLFETKSNIIEIKSLNKFILGLTIIKT